MLFRWDEVTYGPGRCGGAAALLLLLLVVSFRAGRFGDEAPFGLIEDGGVTEVEVSRVEEDLPDVMSPLD